MKEFKELGGRIIMVGLTILMLKIDWRLALITPPITFAIYSIAFCRTDRIYNQTSKLILDTLTWMSYIGYLVFSIILSNNNIEGWYSWLIGIIVWLIFGQLLGFL